MWTRRDRGGWSLSPPRWPLLGERGHPLAAFLAREQRLGQRLQLRHGVWPPEELLRCRQRVRAAQQQVTTQLRDHPGDVVRDVGDQPYVQCRRRVERLTREIGGRQLRPATAL